jgi:putative ABC transport system permease protein
MSGAMRIPLALPTLLYQCVALALAQIWANKVRGVLTTLGILIGVAAVSAVIALIDGMKQRVLDEFDAYGTNKIFVQPQWRKSDYGRGSWAKLCFKNSDFDELLERCPAISSYTRDAGYGGLPIYYRGQVAEDRVEFHGVDPMWQTIERRGVSVGRGFTMLDSQQVHRVCLINERLRDQLKLDRDPTGQIIDVFYFGRMLVVGMLEQPLTMMGSQSQTGEVVVPFSYSTYRYAFPTYYSVTATSTSRETVEDAKAELEFYMRQKRHLKVGEEPNFRIETAARAVEEINEMANILKTFAGGIVAISLLVGGVGIMNIMLVSVSERTREIGLRKAVGARPGVILTQFLVEAVVLCLLGGALGLIAGQGLTTGVASFLPSDPNRWQLDDPFDPDPTPKRAAKTGGLGFVLPPSAIVLAFGFSAGVGVVFGMFPAIKAAALDPIEALRHE